MINQRNIATFIDNIIVTMDTKEGYDKLVEEVLNKLEKNNLFVKPEKYWQKVKEVEFLDVVIGPQEVEMQKGKSGWSSKLASAKKYKGNKKVSRACKLLQIVH